MPRTPGPVFPTFDVEVLRGALFRGLTALRHENYRTSDERTNHIKWLRLRAKGWGRVEFTNLILDQLEREGRIDAKQNSMLKSDPTWNESDMSFKVDDPYWDSASSVLRTREHLSAVVQEMEHRRILQLVDHASLRVTEYGEEVLFTGPPAPEFPTAFIDWLKAEVPGVDLDADGNVDATVEVYIRESLSCFDRGCYLAAVFLVGAASEHMLSMLSDITARWIGGGVRCPSKASDQILFLQDQFIGPNNKPNKRFADPRFNFVRDGFLHDINYSFEVFRRPRNEVGHPHLRRPIDPIEARALLHAAFPTHARRVFQLVAIIRGEVQAGRPAPAR